jgi:hypothetical protein
MRLDVKRGAWLVAAALSRRVRAPSWLVPGGALVWELLRHLLARRDRARAAEAPGGAGPGSRASSEDLRELLLPPTERLWELYDEEAVEGLQAASEDPMRMAELMRE